MVGTDNKSRIKRMEFLSDILYGVQPNLITFMFESVVYIILYINIGREEERET